MKAELKALKDEIGAPVDKAEKAKAADPKFLKDLRVVLGANKPYWNNRLVEDTFQGGEYLKKIPVGRPCSGVLPAIRKLMSPGRHRTRLTAAVERQAMATLLIVPV